jgi:hypothetical protein
VIVKDFRDPHPQTKEGKRTKRKELRNILGKTKANEVAAEVGEVGDFPVPV